MSEEREFIKISPGARPKILKGQFRSMEFQDGDHYVIYIPSINLSAYGPDKAEASEMMKDALSDAILAYNRQTKAELFSQLKELGWELNKFYATELSKSAHIDKEGILRDFDLDTNTVVKESLVTV